MFLLLKSNYFFTVKKVLAHSMSIMAGVALGEVGDIGMVATYRPLHLIKTTNLADFPR
jgi:hypothetical protein